MANNGTMKRAELPINIIQAYIDALFVCKVLDGTFLDVMGWDEKGVEEDLGVQSRSTIFNSMVDHHDLEFGLIMVTSVDLCQMIIEMIIGIMIVVTLQEGDNLYWIKKATTIIILILQS